LGGGLLPLHVPEASSVVTDLRHDSESLQHAFLHEIKYFKYRLDCLWEKYPNLYIVFLASLVVLLVSVGGVMFYVVEDPPVNFGQALWKSWCCVSVIIHHTKEERVINRGVGFVLCFGGLTFFGILVGTISANTRLKLEALRSGQNSAVVESDHIVVAGYNNNMPSLLRAMCYAHETKLQEGTAERSRETIVLLSKEKQVNTEKECEELSKMHPSVSFVLRTGDLKLRDTYEMASCSTARKVVLLAPSGRWHNSLGDARVVSSLLALQRSLMASVGHIVSGQPGETQLSAPPRVVPMNVDVVCQVSKASTARLICDLGASMTNWLNDNQANWEAEQKSMVRVQAVKNLSANVFVQCMRQEGLIQVYRSLLSPKKASLSIKHLPALQGFTWKEVRLAMPDAVVCGLVRGQTYDFFPQDSLVIQAKDRLLLLSQRWIKQTPLLLKRLQDVHEAEVAKKRAATAKEKAQATAAAKAAAGKGVAPEASQPSPAWTAGAGGKAGSVEGELYRPVRPTRRQKVNILLVGWAGDRTAVICDMLNRYAAPGSTVVVLSEIPLKERTATTKVHQERVMDKGEPYNMEVIHLHGSPMSFATMQKAVQTVLKPSLPTTGPDGNPLTAEAQKAWTATQGLSILVVPESPETTPDIVDEQSVFQILLAERAAREAGVLKPGCVGQVYGTQVAKQVSSLYPHFRCLAWGQLNALFTNQILEHPELHIVWDELLSSGTGEDIFLKRATLYHPPANQNGQDSKDPDGKVWVTFRELEEIAHQRGETALGYYKLGRRPRERGHVILNPPKNEKICLDVDILKVVVISAFEN